MKTNSEYWADRAEETQERLTTKSIRQAEEQLKVYYANSMRRVISKFEDTYNHLLSSVEQGREPTPADLYKLDKYWQMQSQLKKELQRLGDRQAVLFSDSFEEHFTEIYRALSLKNDLYFRDTSKEKARQVLAQIWCADGKSWSQRIWDNTDKLQQALNDKLIDCVITGRKSGELKQELINQFNVAYNRADNIVRTELANIQTQAAQQRYKDYGITEVELRVGRDERTCPICNKLDGTRYSIYGKMPVPVHPKCRCCILPVIDSSFSQGQTEKNN